ncbi:hypothetical protein [Polyangium jinanense]|uniref:Uncharacterized protein n=1 Tax=Polyangium jinanense TaxID=2829994 RepID=A0A9X4ASA2_9BACT|nr:hypothetical protein [Polyangium jinanense]MDC3955654.1 hypothetical protein [Polyangium jinanense]MDC3982296.1 hypothetical protein [Polyangium jinanense]
MRRLRLLNLSDLKLGLDDLFTQRLPALTLSSLGKGYVPSLKLKKELVDDLPPALTGGRPLAEELDETDRAHDGFGAALYYTTEVYLRLPGADPALVAAAKRIRAAFIPELEDLRDSYADEAAAAVRRKDDLPALEADLKLFPTAKGGTLHDWAIAYLAAGEKLSTLLSKRADVETDGRKHASKLRSETVALLNRVRNAIADDVATMPELPRDLDAQIFGYLDELEQRREVANRAAKAAKEKKDAAAIG